MHAARSYAARMRAIQLSIAMGKCMGWLGYMWPKADQTQPLQKWSYVKAVTIDGTAAYVGAGFYQDNK